MAISGVISWLPTIDEFIDHWCLVDDIRVPNRFVLSGNYSADDLTKDRKAIADLIEAVDACNKEVREAAAARDEIRAKLRPRMLQFGPTVRGLLPDSLYLKSIPATPRFSDSVKTWKTAAHQIANLWATINYNSPPIAGFKPPLLLSGDFTQECFAAKVAILFDAYGKLEEAEHKAGQARDARDERFAPVYQRLKQYRLAVASALQPNSPLLKSLPSLTPPPEMLPEPVHLIGTWRPEFGRVAFEWTASPAEDLQNYSVRAHPGPRYAAGSEQTVADLPADMRRFETDALLAEEGSVAWYKVYVVTKSGAEKGSNAVKIVRP
ncbi:MAG TPA: hypothetical protein VHE55_06180 [Fimbriimonadaceae bacterium]|nr:hypothetical protein [Fimbriimonadaceae bacterium]